VSARVTPESLLDAVRAREIAEFVRAERA